MYRLLTLLFLTTSAWATDPVFTIGSDPIIDITGTGQGLSLGDDHLVINPPTYKHLDKHLIQISTLLLCGTMYLSIVMG
jgi:hypothetical protein